MSIGGKHDVFMCYEGIAIFFENLEYVKPLNEGIIGFASRMFSKTKGIAKPTHLMHIVHMGGLDKTIWFACFNGVLK